ncbi:ferredoxin [Streptomyces sp. BE308]|uniref:ferredoxin n=1 Tax=Streptomyces sp. BE308 TaxID=3002529 RepID=UPI002E793071|nr:ferredoxin [Streptomyces sp. BE308]MEE1794354.1 ferredoxin [Streptomyces sp. BE308]
MKVTVDEGARCGTGSRAPNAPDDFGRCDDDGIGTDTGILLGAQPAGALRESVHDEAAPVRPAPAESAS